MALVRDHVANSLASACTWLGWWFGSLQRSYGQARSWQMHYHKVPTAARNRLDEDGIDEIQSRIKHLIEIITERREWLENENRDRTPILQAISRNEDMIKLLTSEQERRAEAYKAIKDWRQDCHPSVRLSYWELINTMASRVLYTRRPLPPAAGDLSISQLPIDLRKTRSQQVKKKSYQSPILPPSARPTNSNHIQLSESDAFRLHDEFTASTINDASSPVLWDKFLALNIQFEKYLEAWHKEAEKSAMNEHRWRTERDKLIVQYGEAKVICATELEDYIFKRRTAIMMKINEAIDARRMFRLDVREHGMDIDGAEDWTISSFLKPPEWNCYDRKSSVDGRVRYYNEEDEHFHWSPAREKTHIERVNPQTIRDWLRRTSSKCVQSEMRPWINNVASDPDLKPDRHDEDSDWVLGAGSWEGQYLRARARTWENLKRKFADRMFQGRTRQEQVVDDYADRHKKALKKMRSEAEVDFDGPKFLKTSQS